MRNPGRIYKVDDDRIVIHYNEQPLYECQGITIFNLVDEDYNLLLNDEQKPRILMKKKETLQIFIRRLRLIGFVD